MFGDWTNGWRRERGGWWRAVAIVVSYLGIIALLGAAISYTLHSRFAEDEATPSSLTRLMIDQLAIGLTFFGGLLAFWISKRVFSQDRPSSLRAPGAPWYFGLGLASFLFWVAGRYIAELAIGNGDAVNDQLSSHGHLGLIALFGVTVLSISVQAGSEEAVFRGYLLPRFAAWFGPPIAVIGTTLLFTILHISPGVWGALMVLGIALTLAASVIRLGSIIPAVGMHVGNNVFDNLAYPEVENNMMTIQDFAGYAILLPVWLIAVVWLSVRRSPAERPGA